MYAEKMDCHRIFLCSAKTGDGIQEVFAEAVRLKWEKYEPKPLKEGVLEEGKELLKERLKHFDKYKDDPNRKDVFGYQT